MRGLTVRRTDRHRATHAERVWSAQNGGVPSSRRFHPVLAAAIDVVIVGVFAATGRASHGEGPAGVIDTAWPFLAGLALGWIATLAWRRPAAPVRTGVPVWLITVAAGMTLRALTGQGIAVAFILVASVVLGALLIGWRGIAALVARKRRTA